MIVWVENMFSYMFNQAILYKNAANIVDMKTRTKYHLNVYVFCLLLYPVKVLLLTLVIYICNFKKMKVSFRTIWKIRLVKFWLCVKMKWTKKVVVTYTLSRDIWHQIIDIYFLSPSLLPFSLPLLHTSEGHFPRKPDTLRGRCLRLKSIYRGVSSRAILPSPILPASPIESFDRDFRSAAIRYVCQMPTFVEVNNKGRKDSKFCQS